jgi:hypothetical protein
MREEIEAVQEPGKNKEVIIYGAEIFNFNI